MTVYCCQQTLKGSYHYLQFVDEETETKKTKKLEAHTKSKIV